MGHTVAEPASEISQGDELKHTSNALFHPMGAEVDWWSLGVASSELYTFRNYDCVGCQVGD